MMQAWHKRGILILVIWFSLMPAGRSFAHSGSAAPPTPPAGTYAPSGIPVEDLTPNAPLTHLNIRLPAQDPDAATARLAAAIAAEAEVLTPDAPAAIAPEIDLLAAGLDDDPVLIFDYVRNNYDFLPSWGLLKSPVETILARAGNPFDQAALLAALLNAAGYETRYVVGTVRMPASAAMNWAGVVNQDVLWYAFAGGGIPSQVTGGVLRLNHVWVKVKVGSTWYALDPSFKSYTSTTGIDLPAIMGYNRTNFLTASQSGSTIAADYVQRINETQLQGRLTTYATNLLNHLRANAPAAPLADVIGGRVIVPQTNSALPTQLPYTVESTAGEVVTLPDSLAFKLRVQMPGLDHQARLTDIAGQRVTVFHVAATPADQAKIDAAGGIYNVYPAYGVNMKPELRVGGALAATGSATMLGATERVTITLRTPWLDNTGVPLDFGFVRTFWSSNWYALALRLGDMSDAALSRCTDRLAESLTTGGASSSEPILGQGLHCLGMAQLNEYGHLRRLAAQVGGTLDSLNLGIMVVAQDTLVERETSGQLRPLRIRLGSYYVDAQLNLGGVNSIAGDANRERGYMSQVAWAYSAAEGAIMEQLQGNPGLSTVRVLDLANRQGLKIYRMNAANFATIAPLLTYSSSIKNQLINDARAGYDVIVPERNVTLNAWAGTGWLSYDPNSGSMGTWLNGSLAGVSVDAPDRQKKSASDTENPLKRVEPLGLQPASAGFDVSGWEFIPDSTHGEPISGGSGSQKEAVKPDALLTKEKLSDAEVNQYIEESFDWAEYESLKEAWADERRAWHGQPEAFIKEKVRKLTREWVDSHRANELDRWHEKASGSYYVNLDPVDPVTGAYLYVHTDLAYGSLGLPTLFTRRYSSANRLQTGALGRGWTHSYAVRLDRTGVWVRSRGDEPALDKTAAIAGVYATMDIATTAPGVLPHPYLTIGSEATDWTVGQGVSNAWVVTRGDGTQGRFVRLPDDTYALIDPGFSQLAFDAQQKGTLQLNSGARLRFDASGRLTSLLDSNSNATTLAYDGQGRLSKITDPVGRVLSFGYTGDRLTQLTDPAGRVFRYQYDGKGDLVSYTDPAGRTYRYEYDPAGRMLSYFDTAGVAIVTNTYDALGRVASQRNCLGGVAAMRFGDGHNTVTDHAGRVILVDHNRRGWVTRVTDPLGGVTAYDLDARGRVVRETDARGAVTTFTFDGSGNLLAALAPLSRAWAFRYDADDNLVTVTDPLGYTTRYGYDAHRNLTTVTDALGHINHLRYDAMGQLLDVTDPVGHKTTYGYDLQGNLVTITNPLGHALTWVSDALGRITRVTDANAHTATLAYDLAGNLAEVADPLGNRVAYTHTDRDLVANVTDPLGRVTRYTYNPLGALTQVTDAAGAVTHYSYDASVRLTGMTDAGGVWVYALDAAGWLQRTTDPLGRATEYARDPTGAVTQIRYPDNSMLRYGYNMAGEPVSVTYPDGTTVALTRDATGALIEAFEPGQRIQYTRDALGRVTAMSNQSPAYELAYTYDAASNRTGMAMTSGGQPVLQLAYAHDAADRLIRLADTLTGQAVDYTYDAADNLLTAVGSNGARTTYRYDAADRLSGAAGLAAGLTLFDRTYTYDAAGNLTRRVEAGPGASTEDFRYTALDQLAEVKGPRATTATKYDALGNRGKVDGPLGPIEYSFDAAGQLTTAGSVTFDYDALGRRTGETDARGITTYNYGRDNRLTGMTLPWGEQWRYGYDYAGRRVSEQGPTATRRFAYNGWLLIAEQGPDGRWATTYAYGPAGLAMRHRSDAAPTLAATFYHSDGLGNIAALTDAAGAPRAAYRHDPFGVSGLTAGLDPNPYRFAGAWGVRAEAAGSELYLMGNRVYDAATSQFLTRDPLPGTPVDPLSQNPYVYARDNPLRYLDPLGLQSTGAYEIHTNYDGSVTVEVNGQKVEIPSDAINLTDDVTDAIFSSG